MRFSARLRQVRESLGISQTEFASKIGIPRTSLINYEKGTSSPSAEFLAQLKEIFGVNIDWFVSGQGEMLTNLPSKPHQELAKPPEGHKVPLLRQKVSCGPGVDWQDENNIVDYIDVFDRIPRIKIERLFALCVQGSSMIGAGIRNGDYVLFDSAKDHWTHDGIYVFALDGEVYCKRLEFDMTKIKIYSVRVIDLDKAELMVTLDKEDISTADSLTIFGRVLYCVHPEDE
jgi:transcriptional regulator with XRE-family HTH domain